MTLDQFRIEMSSYRRAADNEARTLKDPSITLERLRARYSKFDNDERHMADQVLCEWLLSDEEALRFDALVLVGELSVQSALPELRKLAATLTLSHEPSAPYELKKVQRLIVALGN